MMTVRSHDQFNTTIYGLNDRYRGVFNERRVIFMNEYDVRREGWSKGDIVDLYNDHDGRERVAHRFIVIPFSIPEGCTATYFPETNVLVPIGSVAEKSNTPTSKSVVIRIRKSAQEA
jgi:anaerobic selenocysteine-containing dehydrogenase